MKEGFGIESYISTQRELFQECLLFELAVIVEESLEMFEINSSWRQKQ